MTEGERTVETVETVETLQALKRRVYLAALPIAMLAIVERFVFRYGAGRETTLDWAMDTLLVVICVGGLVALWRSPRALFWTETGFVIGAATTMLLHLCQHLFGSEGGFDPATVRDLAGLLYWFPLVYMLAFLWSTNRRFLLLASLGFFVASLMPGIVYVARNWGSSGLVAELELLSSFYLANLIYIALLLLSAFVNERYSGLRAWSKAMAVLAQTDALVQLPNRRQLDEAVARELARARRYAQPLAVMMFDVDHFKQVNDTYGHEVGDAMLKEVASVVRGRLRETDVVGRWGGDEFLVIAPQTNGAQAALVAERLRKAVSLISLSPGGSPTLSIGVAEYRPPEPSETWLKRVDEALYEAKKAGRNRVAVAADAPVAAAV